MSKTKIELITKTAAAELISRTLNGNLSKVESENLRKCSSATTTVWAGYIDGDLVCIWGLVPPTLISDVAYLWLHTTEAVHEHEFIFARKSQMAIKEILKLYPVIVGHCEANAHRSIRWLKWLGATFGAIENRLVPFLIKA